MMEWKIEKLGTWMHLSRFHGLLFPTFEIETKFLDLLVANLILD